MAHSLELLVAVAAFAACGSTTSGPTTTPPATTSPAGETTSERASQRPPAAPAEPEAPTPPPPPDPPKPEPATDPKADLVAAETSAWEAAKPAFTSYCSGCHTKGGKKATKKKLEHFDMSTYPFGGHHRATIGFTIRDVLGISGKKPTMPPDHPGAVKGDELETIKAWTDAWEAAETAGVHGGSRHEEHK